MYKRGNNKELVLKDILNGESAGDYITRELVKSAAGSRSPEKYQQAFNGISELTLREKDLFRGGIEHTGIALIAAEMKRLQVEFHQDAPEAYKNALAHCGSMLQDGLKLKPLSFAERHNIVHAEIGF